MSYDESVAVGLLVIEDIKKAFDKNDPLNPEWLDRANAILTSTIPDKCQQVLFSFIMDQEFKLGYKLFAHIAIR
jgi:hypothetical protein